LSPFLNHQKPKASNRKKTMKSCFQSKILYSRVAVLAAFSLAATLAPAANVIQTVNETSAGSDWSGAIWGSPAAVAASGKTYETPNAFAVRTPNNTAPAAFAGSSLQIDAGGILYLKHNNGIAVVNLILNGGEIDYHGGPGGTSSPLGGSLQVPANSTIISDQSGTANEPISIYSPLSGAGSLSVAILANGVVGLYGTNTSFSGIWTNNSGTILVGNGSLNALGTGPVYLNFVTSTYLNFNTTNNATFANPISGLGNVIKSNTNTVALTGALAYTGSTTISNGVLQIGAGSSLASSATIALAGGTLDASLIGGLSLNPAGQKMACNGSLTGSLTAATADTMNFNLTSTTNDVLNISGSLTLNGNPTLNLALTGFKPSGTYRLINYSGAIQGGGSFTLVPPAGSAETFTLDTSTPGQVNLDVVGSSLNLTWMGDGSANSWDLTSPNWAGAASVYVAGDNVVFNDTGSSVPDILISSSTLYPSSVVISNNLDYYVFDGATTTTGIVTTGMLTKSGTNEVDFSSSGNNFSGPIAIQAGTLSIGVGGSFGSLGTGPITNNGILQVNMSANGVAFNAPISGSGSLQITGGGASVTIGGNGHNTYTGLTTIGNGCQLNIATTDALGSTNTGTVVLANGRLGVASSVGNFTVPEPVTINGTGISGSPGALYVNTAGNNVTWAGPIAVASASQVRVVNPGARMNFANTVLGTNVSLECTAGNIATTTDTNTVMTFSNTLELGSSGTLSADGLGVVVLDGATNSWGGGTTLNTSITLLVNGVLNGGPLEVNNTTTLGGSGTILDPVTVDGTLEPGNAGVGTLAVSNTITLNSDATTLIQINRAVSPNASLVTGANVTCGGTLTVNNLGAPLQAGDTFVFFNNDAIGGTFAVTNLPALSSTNLYWNTSLLGSGIISVGTTTPPTPVITAPALSGTNFTLQVPGSQSGFSYVLYGTPSLAPAAWTALQTNAGNGATLNFSIPITPGNPQMFFRIGAQ
jgi:autotransporter-associated beta strand protein